MPTGKVKWFSVSKGYGFIAPDDRSGDVFLHLSKVQDANLPTLETGTALHYTIGTKGGKVFAEALSLHTPTKLVDQAVRPLTGADTGAAFEEEWGLRRS